MSRKVQLEQAYKAVVEEIKQVCESLNRPVPNLVAVSKYKPAEDIQTLYDLGHRHFGENYVQELSEKAKVLPKDIHWHFIGNLQSNKVKIVREVPSLSVVETLDSEQKATKLNAQRSQINTPLSVFLQINTSDEPQKAGIHVEDYATIESLCRHVESLEFLHLEGLMTIGSVEQSKQSEVGAENKDFTALGNLREKLNSSLNLNLGLSMGMSSDYIQAIKQGSTNIRVGSHIFGGRVTKEEIKSASN